MITPIQAANHLIETHRAFGGISHMRIQKLIFCAQGLSLAVSDPKPAPLVLTETPLAYRNGPVYKQLWTLLRRQNDAPILTPAKDTLFGPAPCLKPDQHEKEIDWIDFTTGKFRHFSDLQISAYCHQAGGAWDQTDYMSFLTVERIRDEFRMKVKQAVQKTA